MKKCILTMCLVVVLAGCGSPAADVGIGTGIGAALSGTIAGAKADLERKEQELVALYNEGVAIGMEQEKLDQIEQQIRDIQLGKQSIEAGEQLLDVDWNDPKQTGGAIGLISSLALLWFKRKELSKTKKVLAGTEEAINKFNGTHDTRIAAELYDTVKEKTAKHLSQR